VDDVLVLSKKLVLCLMELYHSKNTNFITTVSKCVSDVHGINNQIEARFVEIVSELPVLPIFNEINEDSAFSLENTSSVLHACFFFTLTCLISISCTTTKKRLFAALACNHWLSSFRNSPTGNEALFSDQETKQLVSTVHKAFTLMKTKDGFQNGQGSKESLDVLVFQMTEHLISGSMDVPSLALEEDVHDSDDKANEVLPIFTQLLIQLLRSMKNVMRFCNLYKENNTSSVLNSTEGAQRLRQLEMIQIYLDLSDAPPLVSLWLPTSGKIDSNYSTSNSSSNIKLLEKESALLSGEACGALLHALRGADKLIVSEFTKDTQGIPNLVIMLLGSLPVENMITIVRILHFLAGTIPGVLNNVKALNQNFEERAEKNASNSHFFSLRTVLVSTLAWCIRSNSPSFPGLISDRRPDLVVEILNTLFAMSPGVSMNILSSKNDSFEEEDTMTQLGILLCDIIRLPNADARVYKCKLAVVNLLMDAPPGYAHYLLLNGGIQPLISILTLQATTLAVEQSGTNSVKDALTIVPILAVLHKMCQALPIVKDIIKVQIFPTVLEEDEEYKLSAIQSDNVVSDSSNYCVPMNALDASPGTLRWKLIKLMTWTDTSVKRCASELLWTLCNEDANEFVRRTGFGNAVHMLGIKGLVNLPSKSSTL